MSHIVILYNYRYNFYVYSPSNITDRTDGCYEVGVGCVWEHDCGTPNEDMCRASTVNDFYTQELSGLIVDEVTK